MSPGPNCSDALHQATKRPDDTSKLLPRFCTTRELALDSALLRVRAHQRADGWHNATDTANNHATKSWAGIAPVGCIASHPGDGATATALGVAVLCTDETQLWHCRVLTLALFRGTARPQQTTDR